MTVELSKKLLISLASVLFSLLLAEVVLSCFWSGSYSEQRIDEKNDIATRIGRGHCYSSDPRDYFPYDLQKAADYKYLKENFLEKRRLASLPRLRKETPHCLLYRNRFDRLGTSPASQKDLILLGDSFVFGEGVRDEDTLTALLGKHRPDLNAINLGKSGAYIYRIENTLVEYLKDHRPPTAVLYFYNINDMKMSGALLKRYRNAVDMQNLRWSRLDQIPGWLGRSNLLSMAYTAYRIRNLTAVTIENYKDAYFSSENEKGRRGTLKSLKKMAAALRKDQVDFAILLYPLLYKDWLGRYPFDDIHDYMLERCRELGIRCIDLRPVFTDESVMSKFRVHPADFHPNQLANRKVIEYILPLLSKWGVQHKGTETESETVAGHRLNL